MKLEVPGCDEGTLEESELIFREAKAEPAQVMELELPHRFRMRASTSGFVGLRIVRMAREGFS